MHDDAVQTVGETQPTTDGTRGMQFTSAEGQDQHIVQCEVDQAREALHRNGQGAEKHPSSDPIIHQESPNKDRRIRCQITLDGLSKRHSLGHN